MMRTHYGHAGQAGVHVGTRRPNRGPIPAAVFTARYLLWIFSTRGAYVFPENNSLHEPGAMSGPDDGLAHDGQLESWTQRDQMQGAARRHSADGMSPTSTFRLGLL
jgi:hypothetical protein